MFIVDSFVSAIYKILKFIVIYIHLTVFKPVYYLLITVFCLSLNFSNSYMYTKTHNSIPISIVKYLARILQCDDQIITMYIITKRFDNRSLCYTFRQLQLVGFTQPNLTL